MAMTHDQVLAIFREAGVLREGHFVLTSGRHSNQFFLMPHLFQYPALTEKLCAALAELYADEEIETVIGPATGGIVLAYEVARQIGKLKGGKGPRAIFTEKTEDGKMALKRQWTLRQGERVLFVEDAVTTGGSVNKAIDAVRGFEPAIVGVGCLTDRSNGAVDFGVPLRSLVKLQVQSWTPEECPLCQAGGQAVKLKG